MTEQTKSGFKATTVEHGIRQTGPQRWEVRAYVGRDPSGRVIHVTRSTTEGIRAARRLRTKLESEVGAGQHGIASRGTFGALLDEWVEKGGRRPRAPLTVERYRQKIDAAIRPGLGSVPVNKITAKRIDDFYADQRARGTSEAMLLEYHRIIVAALNAAVRWDMIPSNPAMKASRPDPDKAERHVPAPEDVRALIDTAAASRTPELAVVITLAALTGMRRGELCGLRWEDVDFDEQALNVRRSVYTVAGSWAEKKPKTRQERRVVLGDVATEALRLRHRQVAERAQLAEVRLAGDAFVFSPTIDGATPLVPDTLTQAFRRLVKRVGGEWTFHSLRHFTATELMRSGHNARTVADRLGHADPSVTMRIYAHGTADQAQAAAAAIESGFASG